MPRPLDLGSDKAAQPMARLITPSLLILLLATFVLSLTIGSTSVEVLPGLFGFLGGQDTLDAIVIGEIRLPRTLIALAVGAAQGLSGAALQDRKSTRLNSSHVRISYAVFCLKKKKEQEH